MYARLIIGLALLLMAALGPYAGFGRAAIRRKVEADSEGRAEPGSGPGARQRIDHRLATIFILRIAAAVLGAFLIVFSVASMLRGHGGLRPQETQPVTRQ